MWGRGRGRAASLRGDLLAAPSFLLAEVGEALARRTGPELGLLAVEKLRALPQLTLLPMSEDLVALATELAVALPVKGADSIYIATAQLQGEPLVTWDREQHDQGSRVVATLTSAPARTNCRPRVRPRYGVRDLLGPHQYLLDLLT